MSGRYIGAALAIVCGVATGYTTFAPELQKLEAERNGEFVEQHGNTIDAPVGQQKGEVIVTDQTIISNDESIGREVKETIKEATNNAASQTSWSGISLFKRAFGSDSSPQTAKSVDLPNREGPATQREDKS